MKTYHRELGLPKVVDALCGLVWHMLYTRHAYSAALNDRYGEVTRLDKAIKIERHEIVEVEMDGGRVNKLVIRKPYDDRRDLVLVCLNDGDSLGDGLLRVKTVWTNLKTDTHRTLRTENYARI